MKIGEHEVVVINTDTVKVGCQTVYREQIEAVSKLMKEWKPAPEFAVGDFVQVAKHGWTMAGKFGKILAFNDESSIGVEFPCPTDYACSIDGKTKIGHGIWFTAKELEKVE